MSLLNSMFTGIVETTSQVLTWAKDQDIIRIEVIRPISFNDIKIGDSIAVNGVCLTVETLSEQLIGFALAYESQQVLELNHSSWLHHKVNLERSLKLDSRIDGHIVTGHVDGLVTLIAIDRVGESWILNFQVPALWQPYIWSKGSCALQGVSLTINQVEQDRFSVCLIPETLKRTNLGDFKIGDRLHLEVDNMARGLIHNLNRLLSTKIKEIL